jgi:peptide/nickel transport system ATP-binding protein
LTPVLQIEELTLGFKTHDRVLPALTGVSFAVGEREIVGVVGESGCGKTITALAVMGLLPEHSARIEAGSILFRGQDLTRLGEEDKRRMRGKDFAMIFQEPMTSLNPVLTVGDQLTEPVRLHLGLAGRDAQRHVLSILEKVGIPRSRNILDEYPHQLSGGMRQRVMIAMALSCNPRLLIADEPTTALDVTIQAQILDLLLRAKEEFGTSVLFITHDLGVVSDICDRVVVMYAGQVVETGSVDEVLEAPAHPYTQGLLRAIPRLDDPRRRLSTIPGSVPPLGHMPSGCRFRPRCPKAAALCESAPPLFGQDGRGARCWFAPMAEEAAHA